MKKILLIEDNLEMRENTAEILELANYEVHTAENGKIGVELAKKLLPDIIVCDVMMPELDGYGVLFMLSKISGTSGIPFIFLTAKTDQSDFRKGMNLGADDYLTKPFDEKELLEAIEVRLKRSEVFKKEYGGSDAVEEFLNEARGLSELSKLSENRKSRVYKKKDVLFHEGDYPNHLYFLKKGKVKNFKMNDEGKEYITELYNAGDFIGYMDLLGDHDYSETAMALEECEILLVPKKDFLELVYSNRDVSRKFIQMLTQNVHENEDRLLELAYNSVRKRVADALLLLEERYKEEGQEHFSMAISRDDLASIVGTATESVIRTLSEFKEDGLIEIKSSTIKILDSEGLNKLKY